MSKTSIYTQIAERIVHYAPTRVLDVGCGDGHLGLALRRLKYQGKYFGVDIDQQAIAMLKQRDLQGECDDLRWMDYHQISQDCMVVKDVVITNQELVRLTVMTRRWFITNFTKEIVRAAQDCSFEPLQEIGDGRCPIIIFQRKKKS